MKLKILLTAMFAVCTIAFVGCTPNVEDENETTVSVTQPPETTTSATTSEANSETTTSISDTSNSSVEDSSSTDAVDPWNARKVNVNLNPSNDLIGWGLGKAKDENGRPIDAVNAEEKYAKYGATFIKNQYEQTIYLTFDEGYENGYTSQILDILKEKNAKAVFFVTYDYCKNSPELVQRMIKEGHIVGNHSYTHPSFPSCTTEKMSEEITKLHNYVAENFNYEMKLFRFPKGEFSEKSLDVVKNLGYTSVFWSFAHLDWDVNSQPSSEQAYQKITNATHNGAIYLLHAVSKANTECLGNVLDYWENKGYTVGRLLYE